MEKVALQNGHQQHFGQLKKKPLRHQSIMPAQGPWAHTILDNLNTAVLAFDADFKLSFLNPAAEMLLERSKAQVLGQALPNILPANAQLTKTMHECFTSGRLLTVHEETLVLRDNKTVAVDYTITPIKPEQGQWQLIVELINVDKLKRLTREKTIQNRHAANRAVIRGLAHEIKNPLGGLRGAAQLLAKQLTSDSLKEYTDVIIEEADRLRSLIDRLFGPNKPLKKQTINIHHIIEYVHRLVQAEGHDQINFKTDYDPSLPEFTGDPDQLIQAVLNITQNAIQAIDQQGIITFRTSPERQFTLNLLRHRLVLRIDIEDNGVGIPDSILDEIFTPMVTGRPEGTGLGLAISQEIIQNHGGMIKCKSIPNQTIFSIFLPLEVGHGR